MNRLTNVVQKTNGVAVASAGYVFDAAGRLVDKIYGNNDEVHYGLDVEGRLRELAATNNGTQFFNFGYQLDAPGQILAITNGLEVTHYFYDAAGQLTNEVRVTNGVNVATNEWVYDDAGNWITSPGEGKWRLYNADNEITGISDNATNQAKVEGYVEPGPASNKWFQTVAECRGISTYVNQTNGTFALNNVPLYEGTNELLVTMTDVSGNKTNQTYTVVKNCAESFTHDANGNMTTWVPGGVTWDYEWDWSDRLTKVISNGVTVLENWYDTQSRRIAKKEISGSQTNYFIYVYDGWHIIAILNENGQILETFTRGLGIGGDIGTLVAVTHHGSSPVTNGTFYIHNNHRGDAVQIRSGTNTVATCVYSAFGILTSSTGTNICRFKFSSKEWDSFSQLSYYGYRFYSPQLQRWLNKDPIGDRGGIKLYSYVANNPANLIDCLGFQGAITMPPPPPGGFIPGNGGFAGPTIINPGPMGPAWDPNYEPGHFHFPHNEPFPYPNIPYSSNLCWPPRCNCPEGKCHYHLWSASPPPLPVIDPRNRYSQLKPIDPSEFAPLNPPILIPPPLQCAPPYSGGRVNAPPPIIISR